METGHQDMLDTIDREVRQTRDLTGRERLDERVMAAMRAVPREAFVPPEMKAAAYANGPLPIGHGQTISQPYIVALMTDLLAPGPGHRVLEIGTGSGYQTAILSQLCREVFSLERVPELSRAAGELLRELGYDNIQTRVGDGYRGWPEQAPFDGIIVTAAAPWIPPALLEQLRPEGRLVIPVGPPGGLQELRLVRKDAQGRTHEQGVLGVAFVPMVESGD